jgi:hypothetical protein
VNHSTHDYEEIHFLVTQTDAVNEPSVKSTSAISDRLAQKFTSDVPIPAEAITAEISRIAAMLDKLAEAQAGALQLDEVTFTVTATLGGKLSILGVGTNLGMEGGIKVILRNKHARSTSR